MNNREKVREQIKYLLNTDDKQVIDHYDDLMWELVEEISRGDYQKGWEDGSQWVRDHQMNYFKKEQEEQP